MAAADMSRDMLKVMGLPELGEQWTEDLLFQKNE